MKESKVQWANGKLRSKRWFAWGLTGAGGYWGIRSQIAESASCITLICCLAPAFVMPANAVELFPAQPNVSLVDEAFSTDATAPAYGFNTDSTVSRGWLNLNNALANEASAVKHFAPTIARQSLVDVSFDWKYSGDYSSKGGVEFRDLYGRLVFAIQGASKTDGTNQLRYSISGLDSDSRDAAYIVEPTWTGIPLTIGKTYGIRFQADFEAKKISFQISDGATVVVQKLNLATAATGLERMVATSGFRQTGNKHAVDNLRILGNGSAPVPILAGETVYAFGDSIVYGHLYSQASFADFIARQEGMTITKRAVNGATVMPSAKTIVDQLAAAPTAVPNYVVFDGGTNDAYPATLNHLGALTSGTSGPFDTSTFAGAFENLIFKIKAKYPGAKLVYVAVAKLGARDSSVQQSLRNIELGACAKWGVAVADVYPLLDTSIDSNRVSYSFDSLQPSGLPSTSGSWTSGGITYPTGTHPNFPAIESFYTPTVSAKMRAIH
jgi:hypothetical protein